MSGEPKLWLREARGPGEHDMLWEAWQQYLEADILPHCDPPISEEDAACLRSRARREHMEKLMARDVHRVHWAFLMEGQRRVGFVQYVIYDQEDGKGFILEYAIDPPHRGRGLGSAMFAAVEAHLRRQGAQYFALNTSNRRNRAFWARLGFVEDKADAWDEDVWIKQ